MQIDSLFNKRHDYRGFNGNVLIAQKGVIIYENAFGYSDIRNKVPLSINSIFQLASLSKTFTGVSTLILAQEGKLSLDDSIQLFFPEFPYHGITIGHLLSHRSGLPNYLYAFEEKRKQNVAPPSNDSIIRWFTEANPVIPVYNKPGSYFSYNNSNYVILASIIEEVSGLSYSEFLRQCIFLPLEMNHSFVDTIAQDSLLSMKTIGHHGNRSRERDFYDGVYGDKGIYSTVEDLFTWYSALYHKCLLNQHWLTQAFTPRSFEKRSRHNYGLGFRMITQPENMKEVEYIYHGGWWAGYSTMFWTDPNEDFVIVVIGNRKNASVYEVRPIIEILKGANKTDQEAHPEASDTL
jgi:CubicO group peptidase (beta-lactamase class C family)